MLTTPDKRLALLAYEKVLALIMSGEAQPGSMVHERRLADMLQMSRTPVRDALLMLEGEGLVLRQGARGLQVRQLRVEEFLHALQVRILLEPEAAKRAAGRLKKADLMALSDRVTAICTDPDAVERTEIRAVDNSLHDLIADTAGNPQMASIIRTMRRQTQVFDLKSLPERIEGTSAEHLNLIDALGKDDGDAAALVMKLHLEEVRRSIVVRLTGG
ncbi:MAG: GntR family transcriptional regulator [Halioglobus sp.]|tara:strand:+ start:8735 stop:9382 length:648 start_codon:yes stop_codon:yes gene_type:complete